MARGKQATETARRRLDAAMEHIDRLVEQLTDAKQRARDAEARAAKLEGLDLMAKNMELRNDQMLKDATAKLQSWRQWARRDRDRRQAAIKEIVRKLVHDLKIDASLTPIDTCEFLEQRYPAIMLAITGDKTTGNGRPMRVTWSSFRSFERKLSDDELRRFQRLVGERGTVEANPNKEAGQMWAELLEAQQAGFSPDEILEYATTDDVT